MESGRASQRWEVPSLGVALTVTLAGGSRTDCESWFVVLEPLKETFPRIPIFAAPVAAAALISHTCAGNGA
jgi:hypothetical protein